MLSCGRLRNEDLDKCVQPTSSKTRQFFGQKFSTEAFIHASSESGSVAWHTQLCCCNDVPATEAS